MRPAARCRKNGMDGRRKGSCKFWRLDSNEEPIEFQQFAGLRYLDTAQEVAAACAAWRSHGSHVAAHLSRAKSARPFWAFEVGAVRGDGCSAPPTLPELPVM